MYVLMHNIQKLTHTSFLFLVKFFVKRKTEERKSIKLSWVFVLLLFKYTNSNGQSSFERTGDRPIFLTEWFVVGPLSILKVCSLTSLLIFFIWNSARVVLFFSQLASLYLLFITLHSLHKFYYKHTYTTDTMEERTNAELY